MKQAFMQQAIALAYDNITQKKGGPYGAVVVKDDKVIGTGTNIVEETNDPTAHAEILAIREACQRLNSTDLSDCEIYASGEPCPMCLAAIYWTGVKTIYYAYPKEPAEEGVNAAYIYKEVSLPIEERAIPMKKMENTEPDKNPMTVK